MPEEKRFATEASIKQEKFNAVVPTVKKYRTAGFFRCGQRGVCVIIISKPPLRRRTLLYGKLLLAQKGFENIEACETAASAVLL